ncbi:MAG: peptidase S41 [Paracoccaceae bacterium]
MSLTEDLERVLDSVLPTDPSFRLVESEQLDHHIDEARHHAMNGSQEDFLLALMRLLALPGNGHTRLIPNPAISVLPLRFVTIGSDVRLLDTPLDQSEAVGGELISVNGVPTAEIENAAQTFLGGTAQRKRVIGPILLVWPTALRHLGVSLGEDMIEYRIQKHAGQIIDIRLNTAHTVPGLTLYPNNEHGRVAASWVPDGFLTIREIDESGLVLILPSFFDSDGRALSHATSEAVRHVEAHPDAPLLVDLRGNTGGNFLRTMPLIDALSAPSHRPVIVLVDKFTFSAAIVFVAILKHRLGDRFKLVGEEMGDGLTFFAEGGSLDLPASGAVVRYSSAFHDWKNGTSDETTPPEIAEKLVPAGQLSFDQVWTQKPSHAQGQDEIYRRVLERLTS